MKYKVIGLKTEKVYYESNTRSDCFKKLTEMNPYIWSRRRGLTNDQLYPEPCQINTKRTTH